MPLTAMEVFSVVPLLRFLSYLLPLLFLQTLLLHQAIPSSVSRPLRFILLFPALYFAATGPFRWRFEPSSRAVAANFRFGIFGPYWILKTIEWGLAKDVSPYRWVGFDDKEEPVKVEAAKRKLEVAEVPEGTTSKRSRSKENGRVGNGTAHKEHFEPAVKGDALAEAGPAPRPSAARILLDSLHLFTTLRGFGYEFGPSRKGLMGPARQQPLSFFLASLRNLVRAHLMSTACVLLILYRDTKVPFILHRILLPFPSSALDVDPSWLQPLANILAYLSVGFSLYAQMILGFEGSVILFILGTWILRAVLPEAYRPAEFDSRDFPPLFNRPFAPKNVTVFWAAQWHALFRMPFISVGYYPVDRAVSKVFGRQVGRVAGATMVFVLSSWMHDQAFWSARYQLPPIDPPLSFSVRWGAWMYFFAQAAAVVLEGLWTRVTGLKVRGPWALAWSYFCIVGLGMVAGRSWIGLGLVEGVPLLERWSWQRFVVPSGALAPPPLWTV